MSQISKETRELFLQKANEFETREEFRQFISDWCDNNDADYWKVWQCDAQYIYNSVHVSRLRKRCIEAVKNTLYYFPTRDLVRIENSDAEELEKNFEIEQIGGAWRLKKVFGVEVSVNNPECLCFALRWRERDGEREDGTPRYWLNLLTTFDFTEAKLGRSEKEVNLLWACGYAAKGYERRYIPSTLYYSFEEFIRTYKAFADEEFEAENLVMVDDTPEPYEE